jgi:hypothetical protein
MHTAYTSELKKGTIDRRENSRSPTRAAIGSPRCFGCGTLSGRSAYVGFASSDDHALRQLDIFLDNALVATTLCDNIVYECQPSYKWTIRRVRGHHKVTFRSTDWVGNVSSYTANFALN